MKYTKAQRLEISQAFSAAKLFVSPIYTIGDMEQFICHALGRARRLGYTSTFACHEATHIIMDRLHPYGNCVEVFLEAKVGVASVSCAGRDAVQRYRHRWLDKLIKEFSK